MARRCWRKLPRQADSLKVEHSARFHRYSLGARVHELLLACWSPQQIAGILAHVGLTCLRAQQNKSVARRIPAGTPGAQAGQHPLFSDGEIGNR